jgi:transcriptional regulator with XRE-family HTH domain
VGATKLTEVVGGRIRQAREARGWTQGQLGDALAEYLGEGWSRPAVSIAEGGGRDFRAVELLALALVLGHPVGWFFRPAGDSPIELPGKEVPAHVVNMLGSGPSAADPHAFEDAVEAVTRVLAEHWPGLPNGVTVIDAPKEPGVGELLEAARKTTKPSVRKGGK